MTKGPVLQAADLTSLALAFLLALSSLLSILYTLLFRIKTRRNCPLSPLHTFNSLWIHRTLLSLSSILIALYQFLHYAHFCTSSLLLSQGVAQPSFFLIALILLEDSLESKQCPYGFLGIVLACTPPFLLEIVILYVAPHVHAAGLVFLEPFVRTSLADGTCDYPLAGTMVLAGFGAVYVPCFLSICWKMQAMVINRGLKVRVFGLVGAVVVGVTGQVVALAAAAWWRPGNWVFEGLGLVGFGCIAGCVVVCEGILVVRPITDAWAAGLALQEKRSLEGRKLGLVP
ncbi:hypothetical protein AMTRI_Chr09g19580 [Amborella trichopoda]